MNPKRSKAGFTLMEALLTLLVLVILTAGISVSITAGVKIYREGIFLSDSALLEDTLSSNLGDILRNATNVEVKEGIFQDSTGNNLSADEIGFVFDNSSYTAKKAYIQPASGGQPVLLIKSISTTETYELVNMGAYPDLAVENLSITYYPENTSATGSEQYGGYFKISYDIKSTKFDYLKRSVNTVVRLLNNP